jgi:hypothetical protein
MKLKSTKYYLKIIDEIQKVRTKNNINWMDILRIAFEGNPEKALRSMKKINSQDSQISRLMKKLTRN